MLKIRRIISEDETASVLPSEAQWIAYPQPTRQVLRFEKKFHSKENVNRATLFVCGLGFFDVFIDGERLDEEYFKPYLTDYTARDMTKNQALLLGKNRTVYAYAYEISDLPMGEHTLTVTVGSGYFQNEDRPEEPYVSYGEKRAIFEMRLCYKDGEELIYSDGTTSVSRLAAFSELYNGDFVDFSASEESGILARVLPPLDGAWRFAGDIGDIAKERIDPVGTFKRKGNTVYDFGVNHSGAVEITLRGARGRRVSLRFAELLNKDGSLNMATSRWECQNDEGKLHCIDQIGEYVLSGGVDEIQPMYSWHCYRYMEICDAEDLEILSVRSVYIHSNLKENGKFTCSEKLFEQIQEKTRRTILNNAHAGILSDCPHREKRPYTGDGQVIAETMFYDLQSEAFFDKWLNDILIAQTESGFIPYTAPYLGGGGGYSWSNAVAVIPEWLYRFSGKKEYIERAYEPLKKWLRYYEEHSRGHIVTQSEQTWCLSDWLAPEVTSFNIPFMSTLCYYKAAETMERFAKILQRDTDTEEYGALKESIAKAINETFFDADKVCYCNGIQGENVLPLAYGIVPERYRDRLREKVCAFYDIHGHFDTGIVATPVVLNYLTENGMEEIAYRMMTQVDYPSYSFLLDGETTISEHWSKYWPDYYINNSDVLVKGGGELSHCHPMFGSVVAWLYKSVAGLDLSNVCDGKIRFAPKFTNHLTYASAKVGTRFGVASISWQREEKGAVTAELYIPQGAKGEFVWKGREIIARKGVGEKLVRACDGEETVLQISSGTWEINAK